MAAGSKQSGKPVLESHVEVISLHHPSLWTLLCMLQLFVLWLVACSTAGCGNAWKRAFTGFQSLNFVQKRRRKAHHSLFGASSKCIPDRFSPLVFNSFPFLCMELAGPFCSDNFYDADLKWDPALRSRHLETGVGFEVSAFV